MGSNLMQLKNDSPIDLLNTSIPLSRKQVEYVPGFSPVILINFSELCVMVLHLGLGCALGF